MLSLLFQVSDALKVKGFEVDRKKVILKEKNIKEVGQYDVVLDLHKEVKSEIKIEVISE